MSAHCAHNKTHTHIFSFLYLCTCVFDAVTRSASPKGYIIQSFLCASVCAYMYMVNTSHARARSALMSHSSALELWANSNSHVDFNNAESPAERTLYAYTQTHTYTHYICEHIVACICVGAWKTMEDKINRFPLYLPWANPARPKREQSTIAQHPILMSEMNHTRAKHTASPPA